MWDGADGRVARKKVQLDALGPERKVSRTDAREVIRATVDDTGPDSNLLDRILACCETYEDRAIVSLRIEGYTDAEIGEELGLSRQTVNRRREAIEERFETKKPGQ